jgi:hypothetical protein
VIFRRRKAQTTLDPLVEQYWDLIHLMQVNNLSLAQILLTVIDHPDLITLEIREEIAQLVKDMQYSMAYSEEFIL